MNLLRVHAAAFMMTLWGSSSDSVSWLYLAVSVLLLASPCQSGCQEASLCCTGRDASCVSRGWRSDRSFGTCYCDQACVSTLDCCHDYGTACPGKPGLQTVVISCSSVKLLSCTEKCRPNRKYLYNHSRTARAVVIILQHLTYTLSTI